MTMSSESLFHGYDLRDEPDPGDRAGMAAVGLEPVANRSGPLWIKLDDLNDPGFSLRLGPLKELHVDFFVGLNGNWPPILVSRHNYSIIDGCYRLAAARRLGHVEVMAYLFDGPSDAAYLEALHRNTAQGLPLTLPERERAASYVLESHRDWSNRRIAELCGLSPGTVGRLRSSDARPSVQIDHLDTKRQGRDNRHRPIDAVGTRHRIRNALAAHPEASLREIARLAGCSPETVRVVRGQIMAVDTVAPSIEEALPSGYRQDSAPDLAMTATEATAAFSSWFAQTYVDDERCSEYVTSIPLSRIYEIADEAHGRASAWVSFARALEARSYGR